MVACSHLVCIHVLGIVVPAAGSVVVGDVGAGLAVTVVVVVVVLAVVIVAIIAAVAFRIVIRTPFLLIFCAPPG